MMIVRLASIADQDAVSTLLAASYGSLLVGAYNDDVLADALPVMSKANASLLTGGTFYVASNDDGPLRGCGGWTAAAPGTGIVDAGLGHIRHVATHPHSLRQGIGAAILARCASDAQRAGCTRLACLSSLQAEPFYAAQGFAAVARTTAMLGGKTPFPVVAMHRTL